MYAEREWAYNVCEFIISLPLIAAINEARQTMIATLANIGEIIFGCEKLFPLVTSAETQATWRWVEFEKIRKSARPSKSGILKAMPKAS